MTRHRLAIFISGRGSNMQALVKACADGGLLAPYYEVVAVFANDPKAAGLAWAAAQGIPTLSLDHRLFKQRAAYDAAIVELLQAHRPDYIALAGYMRVVSSVLLAAYPQRIINIHPADTRQHQGLHGYGWAWEQQLPRTYITVHYVDEGLDTGQIIVQAPVDLSGADSLAEVERRGLAVEHQIYPQALLQLAGAVKQ